MPQANDFVLLSEDSKLVVPRSSIQKVSTDEIERFLPNFPGLVYTESNALFVLLISVKTMVSPFAQAVGEHMLEQKYGKKVFPYHFYGTLTRARETRQHQNILTLMA